MEKTFYVYILASKRNGTLYTGVTSDLVARVHQHKEGVVDGFTKKYGVKNLVYFENCGEAAVAIAREKAVKHWPRQKKLKTIEKDNPEWRDLFAEIV